MIATIALIWVVGLPLVWVAYVEIVRRRNR